MSEGSYQWELYVADVTRICKLLRDCEIILYLELDLKGHKKVINNNSDASSSNLKPYNNLNQHRRFYIEV